MFFVSILGKLMAFLYNLFGNYGISIIIFTLFSKIILLPISIIVQKNSIKMVKIQPLINKIKIDYFGDKERQADEEAKIYKKEGYNAFASLIPLIIQIVLLIGLVEVINHPLTHIINVPIKDTENLINITLKNNDKLNSESSSLELEVVKAIKNNENIYEYKKILKDNKYNEIKNLNLNFLGFNLSYVASIEKGIALLIPIIAGLSALLLCIAQNKMNVLQVYQSNYNKYGMLILSVSLSLYLGFFVPAGVALYWTASNLLAIIQQWLLNIFINPKKYIDKEALEKTNIELKELNNLNKNKKRTREQIRKEKDDYKRFFSVANKHLVFYSESNGFYKYYKGIIEYLLKNTNIIIHYITSDYNDNIFNLEKENKQIKAYYIEEKKLITLMMKMDADVVVMTMPDLQNYHIKRSYIKKDIEYIFIQHGMDSINLTLRNKSLNNYDTIYVVDKYQKEEMDEIIKLYHLKNKRIIKWGYSLLDEMLENYKPIENKSKKTILIAPSWQKDNIVDLCLDELLNELKNNDYDIIVRPHPQHVRHMRKKKKKMKEMYKNTNITIQTDFSSNDTVYNADLIITDWSSIAQEYAYTTKKPVIFIDTPMKIMNFEYKKIKIEPINIWIRNEIGVIVKLNELNNINKIINEMIKNKDKYSKKITKLVDSSIYNLNHSSEIGANYIIETLQNKIKERSKK